MYKQLSRKTLSCVQNYVKSVSCHRKRTIINSYESRFTKNWETCIITFEWGHLGGSTFTERWVGAGAFGQTPGQTELNEPKWNRDFELSKCCCRTSDPNKARVFFFEFLSSELKTQSFELQLRVVKPWNTRLFCQVETRTWIPSFEF